MELAVPPFPAKHDSFDSMTGLEVMRARNVAGCKGGILCIPSPLLPLLLGYMSFQ